MFKWYINKNSSHKVLKIVVLIYGFHSSPLPQRQSVLKEVPLLAILTRNMSSNFFN